MSSTFTIRLAVPEDANRIHELHTSSVKALCQTHYSSEQITEWLKNRTPQGYLPGIKREEIFVAVDGAHTVGFGHAIPGEVVAVFVAPEWATHGVGRAILTEAIKRARSGYQGAVHLDATLNAQEFYKKNGFVEIAQKTVRRNEISLPVIVMELAGDDTETPSSK